MFLTDGIQSVGPPPSPLFKGCYLAQRDAIIFFNFLMLLVFELGNNPPPFVRPHAKLTPIAAVVILTVRRGFSDCASPPPHPSFDRDTQPPHFSFLRHPIAEGSVPR